MEDFVVDKKQKTYEYETSEDVLAKLGWKNFKTCYIILSMAFIWSLIALPVMAASFVVDGIKCRSQNSSSSKCVEENQRFYSINKEFNLPSDDSIHGGDSFLTIFFFGNMLVGTFLSYLADIIGRRIIVIGSLFGMGIFGILCSFCSSFPLLLVARFFQGCFFTPANVVTWILASECISISFHGRASTFFGLFWVAGYCAVAGIAYLLPHWKHFMLATSLPFIIFAIIFWFTIPESFQFLIEKKKVKAAQKWIEKVEKYSKTKLNCDVGLLIERIEEMEKTERTMDDKTSFTVSLQFLWSNKKYILFLAALVLLWIIDVLVYNSISLLSTNLSNNPYLSYIFSGIAEIPAYFVLPILINRIGCKITVIVCHFFTAATLFPLIFIPHDSVTLYTTFWLLGKLGISICSISLFVFGAEIFPSNIRSTCLGIASFFGNIGGMLPFQTQDLAKINPSFPVALYSLLSLIGAITTFALPKKIISDSRSLKMSIKSTAEFTVNGEVSKCQNSMVCENGIEFSCKFVEIINQRCLYKIEKINGDFEITDVKSYNIVYNKDLSYDKNAQTFLFPISGYSLRCQFYISKNVVYKNNFLFSNLVYVQYPLWIPFDYLNDLEFCENSFTLPGYEYLTFKYSIFKNEYNTKILIENPYEVEICGSKKDFEVTRYDRQNHTIDLLFVFDPRTFQQTLQDSQNPSPDESRPISTLPKPLKSSWYEVMANSKYFDVILLSSDKTEIHTHRCALDKFSKVFSKIIDETKEQVPIKIAVNEFDAETIQASLDFLYDKIDSILGKESKVFKFAKAYGIDILKDVCCSYFEKTVNTKNVCEFIQIAYENEFEELKHKCKKLIASSKKEIDQAKIMELPKNIIVDVFYV